MAKKITYLLGAGASANSIPLVNQMIERVNQVVSFLQSKKKENFNYDAQKHLPEKLMDSANQETLVQIIDDLLWLVNEAGNYYSIDTLAKKFYLTQDRENLSKLKKCLISYFTLEQYVFIKGKRNDKYGFEKNKIEKRYGSFIAAIAKIRHEIIEKELTVEEKSNWIGIELNNDIKILSWNYDLQFELNLQRLFLNKKIHFIQFSFQIFPNETTLFENEKLSIDRSKFSMVKLNGNAIWNEFAYHQPRKYTATIFDSNSLVKNNDELLGYYLEQYRLSIFNSNELLSIFNFAWESDNNFTDKYTGHSKNLEMAELIAAETEILVVIGYSFPIFNREMDNRLFKKMGKLEKVYIQDKYPEKIKSTMKNAFEIMQSQKPNNDSDMSDMKLVPKIDFHLDDNTDQFIIPYELTY